MDEWILVASSALRFFQVYAINYQKKTPDSQLGIQKLQGAHSKIKSHFRFQDLAKMIPNHIRSKKKQFLRKRVLNKSISLISTFTLVSTIAKADFSATNWSLGLDFYKKISLSSWYTEVFDFADNNTWWKLSFPSTVLTLLKAIPCQMCIYWFSNMDFQFCQPKFGALPVLQEYPISCLEPF